MFEIISIAVASVGVYFAYLTYKQQKPQKIDTDDVASNDKKSTLESFDDEVFPSDKILLPALPLDILDGDATLAYWFKDVGDTVHVDEMVCEIETSQATIEIPSPINGKIIRLDKNIGDNVRVKDILATCILDPKF